MFKIVEYNESYAKKIATMWTESVRGWFSDFLTEEFITEKGILKTHKDEEYLKVYLVLFEERVVGYISLQDWPSEKNVAYVSLISATDDMRGKGVGKLLMKSIVEYAILENLDRIELHTWSSNLNAIPLYKKTGYFWRETDNGVSLTNYIPMILKNPICKNFFRDIDWYDLFVREVEVSPDDQKCFETDIFKYSFKNGEDSLIVTIDALARNITGIETDDFEITVYQKNRPFQYVKNSSFIKIRNKKVDILPIKIRDIKQDFIESEFSFLGDVKKEIELESSFTIVEGIPETGLMKEAKKISFEVEIRGEKIELYSNAYFKNPITIKADFHDSMFQKGVEKEVTLNISNNLLKSVDLSFKEGDKDYKTSIDALGQTGVSFKYRPDVEKLKKLNIDLQFMYQGKEVSYRNSEVILSSIGQNSVDSEENTQFVYAENDHYRMGIRKEKGSIFLIDKYGKDFDIFSHSPKLGIPLSSDYGERPEIKIEKYENSLKVEINQDHEKFKGVRLKRVYEITPSAWIKSTFYLEKTTNDEIRLPARLSSYYFVDCDGSTLIMPKGNDVLRIKYSEMLSGDSLTKEIFPEGEQWLAREYDGVVIGAILKGIDEFKMNEWTFADCSYDISAKSKKLKVKGDVLEVVSISFYVGAGNHQVIRNYYRKMHGISNNRPERVIEDYFYPEKRNILVDKNQTDIDFYFENTRAVDLNGDLTHFETDSSVKLNNEKRFKFNLKNYSLKRELDSVTLQMRDRQRERSFEFNLIGINSKKEIIIKKEERGISVNNGYFSFLGLEKDRASINSFQLNNYREERFLLENENNTPTCFTNPCFGGIQPFVSVTGSGSLFKKMDFKGEKCVEGDWSGIEFVGTSDKEFKYLRPKIKYLTLPESNILKITFGIEHGNGGVLSDINFGLKTFLDGPYNGKNRYAQIYSGKNETLEINNISDIDRYGYLANSFFSHIKKKHLISLCIDNKQSCKHWVVSDKSNKHLPAISYESYLFCNGQSKNEITLYMIVDEYKEDDLYKILERHKRIGEGIC